MADLQDADIRGLSVHRVGNKSRDEGFLASNEAIEMHDDALAEILRKYFLAPFRINNEYFRFVHATDLQYNEVYNYAKKVFESHDGMHLQSINMLKHLYESSDHPKIKSGEFYSVLFTDCRLDGERTWALGLFKSEGKDSFLRMEEKETGMGLTYEWGVPTKSPDKACLILNTQEEEGFRILVPNSLSDEAQYWVQDFLGVQRINDNHFQTQNYLMMCKDFCEEVMGPEVDKKEQVGFLNRSLEYFNNKERFDLDEFTQTVISEPEYQEQFKNYKDQFSNERGVEVVEDFAIFKSAVKTMKKKFKNLIKLDTDIEIKLNPAGNANPDKFVERGFDEEKGMYFYKVYFNQES